MSLDLVDMPDNANLRIIAAWPGLSSADGAHVIQALKKLFLQFNREGRCQESAYAIVADGHGVVIAWNGPLLSGCSHDKINGIMRHYETAGRSLLLAPPITVKGHDGWLCGTRREVQAWIAAGQVDGASLYLHRAVTDVGAWRHSGCVALSAGPLQRLVALSGD